jgi:hypothetical protein
MKMRFLHTMTVNPSLEADWDKTAASVASFPARNGPSLLLQLCICVKILAASGKFTVRNFNNFLLGILFKM